MFYYLWDNTEAFRKCIVYNILTDRSGKYATNLMRCCQWLAHHKGAIYKANARKKYLNAMKDCNKKELLNFINSMMFATRIMLNWRDYDYMHTHRWFAVPVLRKTWQPWTARRGTIYLPISFCASGDASIVTLYSDEIHGIPEVVSRFDAWQQCRETYPDEMGNYMHSLLRMGHVVWTNFIKSWRPIDIWKRSHYITKSCNEVCHFQYSWEKDININFPVGFVIPLEYGKEERYEVEPQSRYRWVVTKSGKQKIILY